MAASEYMVVPFIGKLKSGQGAGEVSNQLQALINGNARLGWELHTIQAISIEVQPGCLAGLFGAKTQYMQFDQVVFRKNG